MDSISKSPLSALPSFIGPEGGTYDIGESNGRLSGNYDMDSDREPLLGRDLFEDITKTRVSTSSWLEHMDMMSKLDFRFDEGDFSWDDFFT